MSSPLPLCLQNSSSVCCYLVGGAVRDKLLGLSPQERDWVVVGADAEWMERHGFRRIEPESPVYRHPESGEEYALARREVKVAPGYHGFRFETGPQITLEQDLARRDLTINAIAQDATGQLIDPFNGQQDLRQRRLRPITPAFVEDPLRLLRTARFAARLDFRLAHSTHQFLQQMVASGELATLPPERVWQESRRALAEAYPWRYFELLQRCGGLAQLMPELTPSLESSGEPHAPIASPASAILRRAAALSERPEVRFAALLAHTLPAAAITPWCQRQRVEKGFRQLAQRLADQRDAIAASAGGDLTAILLLLTVTRGSAAQLDTLLHAAAAGRPDLASEARHTLYTALSAWHSIDPQHLAANGWSGGELGRELERQRQQAVAQALGSYRSEK